MPNDQKKFWWNCRRIVRWLRISVLGMIFLALCGSLYLNQIGLPDFIKTKLLGELRSRGLELKFSRLRLHSYRGLVAEDLQFGAANEPGGPEFFVKEAGLRLNRGALLKGEFQITSLLLREGRLRWSLNESNQPPQQLEVDGVSTEWRFLPNDQWELDHLQATWRGAKIKLTGTLTNASLTRAWKLGDSEKPSTLAPRLRQVLKVMDKIHFTEPPEIKIIARVDGRDIHSFNADLFVSPTGARTPWGAIEDLVLTTRWRPLASTNETARADVTLKVGRFHAEWGELKRAHLIGQFDFLTTNTLPVTAACQWQVADAQTRWGKAQNLRLDTTSSQTRTRENMVLLDTKLDLKTEVVQTQWAEAKTAGLQATLQNSLTNWVPLSVTAELDLRQVRQETNRVETFKLAAQMNQSKLPRQADASWASWARLEPFDFDWQAELTRVEVAQLPLEKILCGGQWRAPALQLSKLHVNLFEKQFDATCQLEVATREFKAQGKFDFDVHKIEPLLNINARKWLRRYEWVIPPVVQAEARVILPAWTNAQPDWRGEVWPTLQVTGNFDVGAGAFRTIPVSSGRAHFSCSNQVWQLPDLVLHRPEGRVDLAITHHDLTQEYRIDLRGQIEPKAIKPLLGQATQRALDAFEFTGPASVDGSVFGPWADGRGSIAGRIAMTNFTFRGERLNDVAGAVYYTNSLVIASDITAHCDGRAIRVPGARFDDDETRLSLTNAQCTMDAQVVARVIGPKTAETLAPYRFENPPTVTANGSLLLKEATLADMTFDIAGGPFNWKKFRLPQVKGLLRWQTNFLTISNFQGAFYNGQLAGDARFDLTPTNATDFSFRVRAADVDLQLLMRAMSNSTNKLEGLLNSDLTITAANTADDKNWQGFGNLHLRDGLIWEIPAFGMFSTVFNAISPGLGNSRAEEGQASFTITSSTIETKDLAIRASAMRLLYRGTVDFDGRLNARAEAKIFRDTWGIGPLVSVVFAPLTKFFEYKVTGTLSNPKKELLYFLPKFVMMPFHPFRTLREIFNSSEEEKPPAPPPEKATQPPK